MMNKKGDSELMLREIVFVIIVLLFAAALTIFIHVQSSGYAIKEQRLLKQLVLMIDSSEPGMVLTVYAPEIKEVSIDKQKKLVFVKAIDSSKGKSYPYFSNNNLDFKFENNLVKINIEEQITNSPA